MLRLSMGGSVDLATGDVLTGTGSLALRDVRLALRAGTPPLLVDSIDLGGNLRREGTALIGRLEHGRLMAEGARFNVRRLQASLARRTQVEWEAELTDFSGASLLPHLAPVMAVVPRLEGFVRATFLEKIDSGGSAVIGRHANGAVRLFELDLQQRIIIVRASPPNR